MLDFENMLRGGPMPGRMRTLNFENVLMDGPRDRRNPIRPLRHSGVALTGRWPSHSRLPTRRRYECDTEMGFLPLLAAAIPMVTSLASSLMSHKSSKGGGPPPEAGQAKDVLSLLTKAVGGTSGESIKDVIKNIVSTVPSPVMNQVKAAIRELRDAEKAGRETRSNLVNSIDSRFAPQVHAMLASLKAADLQRQATFEHNSIVKRAAFQSSTTKNLAAIALRLANIEKRLGTSAVVNSNRIDVLGGRGVLER